MILYMSSEASYIFLSKGISRVGGYFFLGPHPYDFGKRKLPPPNGLIYIEFVVMQKSLTSTMEAELCSLLINWNHAESMQTALK